MNRDDIVRMAREAGFADWWINPHEPERRGMCYGMLARLVEIAQAREREACAVLCESRHENGNYKYDHRDECAQAIREKGETK